MKKRSGKSAPQLSEELGKAIHLHQNGHLQQAKIIYKKIIRHSPMHPEALHMLGTLYSQTGKLEIAIDLMRKSIKSAPGRPEFLFNLAWAYYERDHLDDAIATYQEYLRFVPDDSEALYWLGRAFYNKKDWEQAVIYSRRALEKSPERVDFLNSLGLAYHEQGDFEQAVTCYKQALKYKPNDFIVLNNLGETFRKLNKIDEAISCFRQVLSVRPDDAKALNNLGIVFREEGKFEEAADNFKKAVAAEPDYAEAHYNLGLVFTQLKMFADAASSFRQALSVNPEYSEAHCNLGYTLYEQKIFDDAIDCLRLALSFNPENPDAYVCLGRIYAIQGDFNNALASCEKALAIEPDHPGCLFIMSTLPKGSSENSLILKQEKAFTKKDLENNQKRDLAFSLGKAHSDNGDYTKSFFYTAEGNRLERGSYEYSIKEDEHLIGLIKKVYSKSYISTHDNEGNTDNSPIFILGMPRSGTSLVEQILASHPDVYGAGELEDIPRVVAQLTGGHSNSEVFDKIPRSDSDFYELLAAEYLSRLRKHSASAKFITDKLPHNFQFIGVIRLALPHARIIHCVRDPMDNCFSIYKNLFSGEHKYAYDLLELGQYYRLYQDLMRHWHDVFPGSIYDIKYEQIVADQEGETRKLLQHCGLSWNAQCLSFYKTSRNVSTLSWTQVRKPIYKDSIQLWEKFREHLEPLRSILSG